jgi:hypothetical protein
LQRQAWSSSDVSSAESVSQQASTLAALTVGSPDQFTAEAKLDVVNFALQVAAHIDPTNDEAVNNLLAAVGSVAQSALESVRAAIAQVRAASTVRRLVAMSSTSAELQHLDDVIYSHSRRLDSLSSSARSVVEGTSGTLAQLAASLLTGVTPGEPAVTYGVCCLQNLCSSAGLMY